MAGKREGIRTSRSLVNAWGQASSVSQLSPERLEELFSRLEGLAHTARNFMNDEPAAIDAMAELNIYIVNIGEQFGEKSPQHLRVLRLHEDLEDYLRKYEDGPVFYHRAVNRYIDSGLDYKGIGIS